jgi:hypothetical protein
LTQTVCTVYRRAMDEFSRMIAREIARAFPGWRLIGREVEGCWYATIPEREPPVIAWGEDPGELQWEIIRKDELLKARA